MRTDPLAYLDKELNTYAMRVKEWYGWHFPEMGKIVVDNLAYAKVVKKMGESGPRRVAGRVCARAGGGGTDGLLAQGSAQTPPTATSRTSCPRTWRRS